MAVAVVTGGGVHLGRAISLKLAERGIAVAVCGINEKELHETAEAITASGNIARPFLMDVTNEGQIERAIDAVVTAFGGIDYLVNNAGIIGPTAGVAEIDLRDWEETLAVNLTGAFLCAKAVWPHLVSRGGGAIVHISSIAGKIAYPLRMPYAVSKWGMIGMTMTMAKEGGPHNIRVNAVCPGPIQGERMRRVIADRARESGQPPEQVERDYYLSKMALGRMVTEEEVAEFVAYLCSNAAAGITGEAVSIAAGWGL